MTKKKKKIDEPHVSLLRRLLINIYKWYKKETDRKPLVSIWKENCNLSSFYNKKKKKKKKQRSIVSLPTIFYFPYLPHLFSLFLSFSHPFLLSETSRSQRGTDHSRKQIWPNDSLWAIKAPIYTATARGQAGRDNETRRRKAYPDPARLIIPLHGLLVWFAYLDIPCCNPPSAFVPPTSLGHLTTLRNTHNRGRFSKWINPTAAGDSSNKIFLSNKIADEICTVALPIDSGYRCVSKMWILNPLTLELFLYITTICSSFEKRSVSPLYHLLHNVKTSSMKTILNSIIDGSILIVEASSFKTSSSLLTICFEKIVTILNICTNINTPSAKGLYLCKCKYFI